MKSQRSKITPLSLENKRKAYPPRLNLSVNIKDLLDSKEPQEYLHISIPKWKIPPNTSSISKRTRRVSLIDTNIPEFAFEYLSAQTKHPQIPSGSDKSIEISTVNNNLHPSSVQRQPKIYLPISNKESRILKLTPQAKKAFYSNSPTKRIIKKSYYKSPRYTKLKTIIDSLSKCPPKNKFIDFTHLSIIKPALSFGEKLRRIQMIVDNAHSIFS